MNTGFDKVMNMSEAIKLYVADGSHISIGGFTINRNPMAAVYEIIRQKIKDLHLYAHSNGQGLDELIGGGCVSKLEIAYGGNGRFAPTCIRFKKAVKKGTIIVEDYSNYQMTLRFLAGAMGVPFLPTRSSLGTDIIDKWGFSEKLRKLNHKIPDKKLSVIDNPFTSWTNATKVVLVPAINTDVTIIHVQKSDRQGTARIEGLTFADIEQAKSAKNLIITCEELIESEELRKNPDQNQIPFFCVDAVVHVPFGAFPTACYRYYDYDPVYLNEYKEFAADDLRYKKYLEKFVCGVKGHQGLLDLIGKKRMEMIKADSRTGYAANLDRR
ncbi:MAG: ketoacid-CoA transferase [Desulfobacteraceae bacterium 4572_123]|nr:MAG: ketoacid-CoA transferase [Desulfobacteraceae bacterium 4572_123]